MVRRIRHSKKRSQFSDASVRRLSLVKPPDKTNPISVDAYGVTRPWLCANACANIVVRWNGEFGGFAGIMMGALRSIQFGVEHSSALPDLSISSRAAGAADLSPCVFLPPAGLNRVEAKHWARWMARPFT